MLNRYPKARYFRAATWSRMLELWETDCIDHHDHSGDHPGMPEDTMPPSPVPSLPSTLTDHESSLSDYTISCPPSPPTKLTKTPLIDGLKPESVKFLAEHRPVVATTSPRRVHQHLTRVLGLGAVGSVDEVATRMDALAVRDSRAQSPDIESVAPKSRTRQSASPYFMRARAMTLLQATPGAELAASHDQHELWQSTRRITLYFVVAYGSQSFGLHFGRLGPKCSHRGNEDGFIGHVAALPSGDCVITLACEGEKKKAIGRYPCSAAAYLLCRTSQYGFGGVAAKGFDGSGTARVPSLMASVSDTHFMEAHF
ncbi:hypothetical protein GGX14DRAFT_386862 [Mycena pura]|uniref:Uncharacterized protein n=1 Tax=Mycena pura TaxID=153505 RepID=A0AAD6YMN1_9AGAR|nr:hypothetical protein GGX14DRAFT_386862 [Mycena pura]